MDREEAKNWSIGLAIVFFLAFVAIAAWTVLDDLSARTGVTTATPRQAWYEYVGLGWLPLVAWGSVWYGACEVLGYISRRSLWMLALGYLAAALLIVALLSRGGYI
jgi:hypothetical protein